MKVLNVHHRDLPASPAEVGSLLDALASSSDRLWPSAAWPAMRFDRPLGVGAVGGHGPIRYTVESYRPGRSVTFRFTAPRGFHGTHRFFVESAPSGTRLVHELAMKTSGLASLSWPLVFRPLHDALLEDALHRGALACGVSETPPPRPIRVRLLRALLRGRGRKHATAPDG